MPCGGADGILMGIRWDLTEPLWRRDGRGPHWCRVDVAAETRLTPCGPRKSGSIRLRRVVFVDEATEHVAAPEILPLRRRRIVFLAGVGPRPGRGGAAPCYSGARTHARPWRGGAGSRLASVQTLGVDGCHPPLGVGVGLRRSHRGPKGLHTVGAEHLVERAGELGVVVAQQETRSALPDRPGPS
jgi:hypothetical protein